ncbi:hypothetical protein HDK77DRAFT_246631 [Phyllosticta capitalensis]|uniref:Uncharacterized protein n=1 Tax=Phyllosticta capitalensis TaxID=121624 RepID=A0ABR1YM62_9PEZI
MAATIRSVPWDLSSTQSHTRLLLLRRGSGNWRFAIHTWVGWRFLLLLHTQGCSLFLFSRRSFMAALLFLLDNGFHMYNVLLAGGWLRCC